MDSHSFSKSIFGWDLDYCADVNIWTCVNEDGISFDFNNQSQAFAFATYHKMKAA